MENLYIIDLFKNILRKKNLFAIVFLVLNILFIFNIFNFVFQNAPVALAVSIVSYLFAVTISLSPLGEKRLRRKQGCEEITDIETLNRLEPLFMEVKQRAMRKHRDFHIDENIQLYIKDDLDANAFAVGRRTICVTTGLLELSDEEIKGVLAHEFGHLATHDTDLVLLISGGNFIITAIATIFKAFLLIFKVVVGIASLIAGEDGALTGLLTSITAFFTMLLVDGLMWLWTKLGIWLVMKTSRDAEYEADAFACDLGYTEGLLSFFEDLEYNETRYGIKDRKNIFAALSSSHPSTKKRIENIHRRIGAAEV